MPVFLESHNPDLELKPGTTKSDIIGFLYRNDDYGYSPRDIHTELDVPHNTAKVTLKRLSDDEFIEKTSDESYHARTDREDLYRYNAALDGLDRMFATHDNIRTLLKTPKHSSTPMLDHQPSSQMKKLKKP